MMEQCPAFLARRAAGSHSVYGAWAPYSDTTARLLLTENNIWMPVRQIVVCEPDPLCFSALAISIGSA